MVNKILIEIQHFGQEEAIIRYAFGSFLKVNVNVAPKYEKVIFFNIKLKKK